MDDLEDRIFNFIIRKPGDEQKTFRDARKECRNGLKIYDQIPLLVADILKSTNCHDDDGVFTISNPETLNYRTCLVYGFVAGRGVHNTSFHKYIIDDGTGAMEFSIFNKPRDLKTITSLHNEAVGLASTSTYKKVSSMMVELLGKAGEHIDGSSILPGSNIALFGFPNVYRNQISLNVISFWVDNERSGNLELAFTDYLKEFYERHKSK